MLQFVIFWLFYGLNKFSNKSILNRVNQDNPAALALLFFPQSKPMNTMLIRDYNMCPVGGEMAEHPWSSHPSPLHTTSLRALMNVHARVIFICTWCLFDSLYIIFCNTASAAPLSSQHGIRVRHEKRRSTCALIHSSLVSFRLITCFLAHELVAATESWTCCKIKADSSLNFSNNFQCNSYGFKCHCD